MTRVKGQIIYTYLYVLIICLLNDATSTQDRLRAAFRKRDGMLRMSEVLRCGFSRTALYAMRDAGELDQVGRGLYRLREMPALAHPDLVTVATKVPRGVICLVSALAHHELTTQVPHEVQIARGLFLGKRSMHSFLAKNSHAHLSHR